jgi:hypothetical protein
MFKVLLWIILVVSILESMWDSFFNATLPAGSIPVIHNAGSGITPRLRWRHSPSSVRLKDCRRNRRPLASWTIQTESARRFLSAPLVGEQNGRDLK